MCDAHWNREQVFDEKVVDYFVYVEGIDPYTGKSIEEETK